MKNGPLLPCVLRTQVRRIPICRTEQDLSWSCFFHTANRFLKHLRDEHGPEKGNMGLNFFDVKSIETYGFPENEYIYWLIYLFAKITGKRNLTGCVVDSKIEFDK